jgi:dihydroflavonol-4-reductase
MILITGATGLVGAHLLYELTRSGKKVRGLVRNMQSIEKVRKIFSHYAGNFQDLINSVEWIEGDVLDKYSLETALDGIERVYHCAGFISFKKADRSRLFMVNQQGTANLVNACLEKSKIRFCHVSSVAALGRSKYGETITENSFWKTNKSNSAYSISKYGAEREVWRAAEEGLEMFVVNPSVIIGHGDWNSSSLQLFNTVNKGIRFCSEGITGYVDVRDVVKIMQLLMDSNISDERFIISAEDVSYRRMLSMIAIALKRRPPDVRLRPWMAELGWRIDYLLSLFGKTPVLSKEIARSAFNSFHFDSSKVKQLLNYQFIPIEESILHTARIFLSEHKKDLIKNR